jgi:hypothetical protein
MTTPFKAFSIEEINTSAFRVPRYSYVWCFDALSNPVVLIEFQGKQSRVDSRSLLETPLQHDLTTLRSLDLCFGGPVASFVEVHRDSLNLFSIFRCKAHGHYFLEDIQGGVGMYSRFIFIGVIQPHDKDEFAQIWRGFHSRGTDELIYEGKAGPMPR